jgi:hypothetical protein
MSTPTLARPDLRAILLDALEDAFWFQKGEVEDCGHCRNSVTGVCADRDHQDANARAVEFENARKQLQRNPECPEVLAVLTAAEGAQS